MKSLSVAMQAALASGAPRLVKMIQLVLRDGTVLAFTEHDEDIPYDLSDGKGVLTYRAGFGISVSDVEATAGMDPDSFEFFGPMRPADHPQAGPVTTEAVLGGRFNNARAKLFEVRWSDLDAGAIKWLEGDAVFHAEQGRFRAEVKDDFARLAEVAGTQIIPTCNAEHGDARCTRVIETEDVTVFSVVDAMEFTVTYSGDHATGFFDKGKIEFTSGDLNGTVEVEIERWTQSVAGTATVKLFTFLAESPAVNDTATVKRGCGKTRQDCMARNNILNFRGKPDVPGNDQIFRTPTPGSGGE